MICRKKKRPHWRIYIICNLIENNILESQSIVNENTYSMIISMLKQVDNALSTTFTKLIKSNMINNNREENEERENKRNEQINYLENELNLLSDKCNGQLRLIYTFQDENNNLKLALNEKSNNNNEFYIKK